MGNTVSALTSCARKQANDDADKEIMKALPIDTSFKLPSPLPTWPNGEGFASGAIDLGGGLQVCQISTFNKIWVSHQGGPDDLGASFFEPSQIPQGFSMLGSYGQPNNQNLFGWVLAGKDYANDASNAALKNPVDYTLVWNSESLNIKKDGNGYFWLPVPPDGYRAVGLIVTNSPQKPSLDKVRCVRTDLTDQCQTDALIWGSSSDSTGTNFSSLRPSNRGTQAMGVNVGTFSSQNSSSLTCLKNVKSNLSPMPNKSQIQALIQAYSPLINLHPEEQYLPSSVTWYFTNGALLYHQGEESNPVKIEPTGSNLPQGGSNDGTYWLDLPVDGKAKEFVKKGNLQSCQVYLHVKPMLGATFTDLAIWVFYPFNGPAKAKVKFINISLGKIGEHVGDWEHVTLRVSNFNGELKSIFLSEHSGGTWVDASELEFQSGSNKPVTYASLHGHAMYAKPGMVLQGSDGIGIRNDTAKSNMVVDTGSNYSLVAAEYLGSSAIVEPPWLNYLRKWGPKIDYDLAEEIRKIEKVLPGKLKTAFKNLMNKLPNEVLGEEGPTGPKVKANWVGDEL
ncbi:hypothetical protein HS088_TW10G00929 [Tripterygium wilfordii]|uniref:Vacuolar protein sorting-associated protein 62 n=2 Tax=Tripterygium wilfordii TaxID=458696 RepID=A0A7J7D6I7_TRIWF|nr:hypothetical protein HS088_TW10G00929 [Tripterygium wilfordii]